MKYIYANPNNIDMMEIETDGNRVTNVVMIAQPRDGSSTPTAAELQDDLSLYMNQPGATIEDALGAWVGGYASVRLADGQDER